MTTPDTDSVSELLSCPFCGSTADIHYDETSDHIQFHEYVVWCDGCDAHMADPARSDVVAAWNRRASRPADAAEPLYNSAFFFAQHLASVLHTRHYAESDPGWQPLPDLLGMLTQINDMVAPLVMPSPDADNAAARDAFAKLDAGLKLAAIGGPKTGPGNATRNLAKIMLPFLNDIEKALTAAPPGEWDKAIEAAAQLVEQGVIQDSSEGQQIVPRSEGNRAGLAYAVAIRTLTKGQQT